MKEEFDILKSLKKQNPETGFKVPANYFDSFDDKMMDIIEAEEKTIGKKVFMVIKPWLSLAAIFTIVALVYYSTPYFNSNIRYADASIEQEVQLDFLSSNLDEAELIDIIVNDDNNDLFNNIDINQELLEGLTIEDIEELVIF